MNKLQYWITRLMQTPSERGAIIITCIVLMLVIPTIPNFKLLEVRYSEPSIGCEDPTVEELVSFLENDTVDTHQYINKLYTCVNFACDLLENANKCGYRGYFIVIDMGDNSFHAITMFNTTDHGEIYIEPQSDKVLYMEHFQIVEKILY